MKDCMRFLNVRSHLRPFRHNKVVSCSLSSSRFYSVDRTFRPLRVLFCGSDEFSTTSLEHLLELHKANPEIVKSIDVVVKQGKPSGRGLKNIRDVPIKAFAKQLQLPIHEIPTFTGWQPPVYGNEQISLVIAVSFGLLVPPRILNIAQYGGLNVHPSLLPAFRGPAPLQHTLLNGIKDTGITVQTLHPQKFDHGHILAQDVFSLPEDVQTSYIALRDYMGPRGAKLLTDTIQQGLFVAPSDSLQHTKEAEASQAPKLTKEDAHIDWQHWTSDYVLRAQKAMGNLWSIWEYKGRGKNGEKSASQTLRIQWHDLRLYTGTADAGRHGTTAGVPFVHDHVGVIPTCDGKLLTTSSVTIEGRKKGWPGDAAKVVQYLIGLSDEAPTGETTPGLR